MLFAAENALKTMQSDQKTRAAAQAYTEGINAYIQNLKTKDLPLEYKIMNYKPELWSELKTALLLKNMALSLTGRFSELRMTKTREILGDSVLRKLYPYLPPFVDPVIPSGSKWDFKPKTVEKPKPEYVPANRASLEDPKFEPAAGSNNWAISGTKSKSGYPILCNDPHLGLRLPSIWYEIQLVSPGVNVYGVSLPGAPSVIIGFNKNIAWGLTNAGSDVLDWYQIKFRDSGFDEYYFDGEWQPTKSRVETIKIKGEKTLLDTVYYTHHGPVVYLNGEKPFTSRVPLNAAMRWTAHDGSSELQTFLQLNRGKNYQDYLEALKYYDCPAQNFVFGSVSGDIAIQHMGKFPIRWQGQGSFILDGTLSTFEWSGWVPRDHIPMIKNPARGFVSSANQNPADLTYPYYLGWDYESFERGVRINQLLGSKKDITPEDMISMQKDVVNLCGQAVLPLLLELIKDKSLTPDEQKIQKELKSWNYENRAELISPLIFETWWNELYSAIWQDDMTSDSGTLQWPGTDVTIDLILSDTRNEYFDDKSTSPIETLTEIALKSFRSANERLTMKFGKIGPNWKWGTARGTDINHLAGIPGLGRTGLQTDGNYNVVNAISKNFGPSWRMVVAFGPDLKAWGIYPGGQSGNPGSKYYDNMVDDWVAGIIDELLYLESPDLKNAGIVGQTVLRGLK